MSSQGVSEVSGSDRLSHAVDDFTQAPEKAISILARKRAEDLDNLLDNSRDYTRKHIEDSNPRQI